MLRDQTVTAQCTVGAAPAQKRKVRASGAATFGQSLRVQLISVANWISLQMERHRSRRALLEMTDDQLKDIGLSRGEAYSESMRRLWD